MAGPGEIKGDQPIQGGAPPEPIAAPALSGKVLTGAPAPGPARTGGGQTFVNTKDMLLTARGTLKAIETQFLNKVTATQQDPSLEKDYKAVIDKLGTMVKVATKEVKTLEAIDTLSKSGDKGKIEAKLKDLRGEQLNTVKDLSRAKTDRAKLEEEFQVSQKNPKLRETLKQQMAEKDGLVKEMTQKYQFQAALITALENPPPAEPIAAPQAGPPPAPPIPGMAGPPPVLKMPPPPLMPAAPKVGAGQTSPGRNALMAGILGGQVNLKAAAKLDERPKETESPGSPPSADALKAGLGGLKKAADRVLPPAPEKKAPALTGIAMEAAKLAGKLKPTEGPQKREFDHNIVGPRIGELAAGIAGLKKAPPPVERHGDNLGRIADKAPEPVALAKKPVEQTTQDVSGVKKAKKPKRTPEQKAAHEARKAERAAKKAAREARKAEKG